MLEQQRRDHGLIIQEIIKIMEVLQQVQVQELINLHLTQIMVDFQSIIMNTDPNRKLKNLSFHLMKLKNFSYIILNYILKSI